jgi:hypothetical protein
MSGVWSTSLRATGSGQITQAQHQSVQRRDA